MKITNKRGFKRERTKSYSTQNPMPKNYDSGKAVWGGGSVLLSQGIFYKTTIYVLTLVLAQHRVLERISEADVRGERKQVVATSRDQATLLRSSRWLFLYNLMIPWSSPVRDPGDNLLSATALSITSQNLKGFSYSNDWHNEVWLVN